MERIVEEMDGRNDGRGRTKNEAAAGGAAVGAWRRVEEAVLAVRPRKQTN